MLKIAVVGLGRFGMSLARHLQKNGAQVIAIDRHLDNVNEIKDDVDLAVRLDSTDQASLLSQEIDKVDICVVAIGEGFENALLTAVIARKLGVPRIICRAQTTFHAEIFRQIGVDEVVQPEISAGEQLARSLANPHVEDFLMLADGYSLIELRAPQAFCDKSLKDLALRSKYSVNLVAIKRASNLDEEDEQSEQAVSVPTPDDVIHSDDILVLVGSDSALARLPKE